MQILIFTGAASARAAAASAAAAAAAGINTLLASFGPDHGIAAMIGATPSSDPTPITPQLTLWTLDALRDLGTAYDALRSKTNATTGLNAIIADELPLIPGADLFLGVAGLRRYAQNFDLACVDVGSSSALLRAMAVPDTFRWSIRLLLGLDRNPGRSPESIQRALIPTTLIPFPLEWVGQVQQARADLEFLRDDTVNPQQTRVRYVMSADRAGLTEAQIAIPALHLYGLAVDALIGGPLLPAGAARLALEDLAAEQAAVLAEAQEIWKPRPLLHLEMGATPADASGLAQIGKHLYAGVSPLDLPPPPNPISFGSAAAPAIEIALPGLRREDLGLTVSGDELIVRVGSYRRHVLLPDTLRHRPVRAARNGDALVIRPRE